MRRFVALYGNTVHIRLDNDADDLPPQERGKSPDDLINDAIKKVMGPDALTWDRRKWETEILPKWIYKGSPWTRGVKLYDVGLWNLMQEVVSNEGYNFLNDGGGYYSNYENWNAGMAMPYISGEFASEPEYLKIAEGYVQLPIRLLKRYEGLDGRTHLRQRLRSFARVAIPRGQGVKLTTACRLAGGRTRPTNLCAGG